MRSSSVTSPGTLPRLSCSRGSGRPSTAGRCPLGRRGASVVEVAFVMPVFLLFIFFIMQFGHAYMVRNMLNAACRTAARFGSTAGVTTSDAEGRILEILSPIADSGELDLIVKNAPMVDLGEPVPDSSAECRNLPDVELSTAAPRQPFLVRAEVRYGDVAFIVFPGFADMPIVGQAVTRHE
ncbi:MAG: TadE/TadG family type IV pilus assembly protein [Thermoguttaceae bacterium]